MDLMSPKNCVFSLVLQEERHRTIDPLNAPSSRNAVDMLMKFVPTTKFKYYLDLVNVSSC